MSSVIDIVLPVFGICLLGYLSVTVRVLTIETGEALTRFVLVVAVPALLFANLANGSFHAGSPLQLWTAYFGGVAVTWALAAIVTRKLFKRDYRASVIAGIAASFTNTVVIGIPLIQRAYGDELTQILLLIVSIHLPLMLLAATLLVEYAAYLDSPERAFSVPVITGRVAKNLATNAIVIAITAGAVWRIAGLPLTGPAETLISWLGRTAGPLALFALGISLHKYGIASNFKQAAVTTFLALMVMPALVLAIGLMLPGLPADWLRVAVVTAACPTGINAFIFAAQFRTAEGLTTNTIMMSTGFGAITIAGWLLIAARI